MKIGIVGLPNVGKSTLFNALTRSQAQTANFPFTTIEPNVGVVAVPDERLQTLSELVQPGRVVPASVEFLDIAGLIGGAAQGEGLGNKFLGHIREVDAVAEVVRCFRGETHHVSGSLDPARDAEVIETELALADLETVSRRITEIEAKAKTDPKLHPKHDYLKQLEAVLAGGGPARNHSIPFELESFAHDLHLLTGKPLIYVANVDEEPDRSLVGPIQTIAEQQRAPLVLISAKLESELGSLSDPEIAEYLRSLGQDRTGLERLIQTGY